MIYESDKVFSAPDYVSVSFPVILDDGMSVIEKAITDLQFNNYLNSMDSKYTFLPPTNNALAPLYRTLWIFTRRPTVRLIHVSILG